MDKKKTEVQDNPVDSLSDKLLKRLKEFKESKLYCVVDRVNSLSFADVFRDAINSYKQDTIICERLYLKEKCISVKRPVYEITDETKQLYNEFINFSEKELSGDITEETLNKFKDFQEKLDTSAAKVQEVDVSMYKSGYNGDGYFVTDLNEIPDDALEQITKMIARFVFEYFLTMKFAATTNYAISIFPVNYEEYIDIVAQFVM